MTPDRLLPPLRGLDENAGDVDSGVIGGRRRRLRRQPGVAGPLAAAVLIFTVLATGILTYISAGDAREAGPRQSGAAAAARR